jgi:hypothetical protein
MAGTRFCATGLSGSAQNGNGNNPEESAVATKKVLKALEKVFAAEIEGRLPFQSKALIYLDLQDEGLVQPMERTFGGRHPVIVKGWQLTHVGRLAYCSAC